MAYFEDIFVANAGVGVVEIVFSLLERGGVGWRAKV